MKTIPEEQLEALEEYLADGAWHHSRAITRATGLGGVTIRAIANECCNMVSNTSQGYKLLEHADLDEINHSIADLFSRINKIRIRALSLSAWRDSHFPEEQGDLDL